MKLSILAVATLMLLASAGAQAAVPVGSVSFNGVCAGSATTTQAACTGVNGSYGNSATIAATDATLKVKITAWQANQSTNKITNAFLGAFSGGFGVTGVQDVDTNGVAGGTGTHQMDNVAGYTDFILLQFSRAVRLDGLNMNLYSPYNDSDASIWNGTALTPAGAWNSTIDLTNKSLDPTLWSNTAGGSANGYRDLVKTGGGGANGNFSQVWLVSSSVLTTDRNDGFKLTTIWASPQTPPIPEPATWAMMIAGFGAIGASLRRRRAQGGLQTA